MSFNYSHEVVPTDVSSGNEGQQVSDRFNATFKYDITPDITVHLEGVYTHGEYTQALITPGTVGDFDEDVYAVSTGVQYHVNKYLDVESGYIFSGVDSGLALRDYTRDQVYVGVRGTY